MTGIIISRNAWGAQPPRGGTPRSLSEVDTGFIHYSDVHESIDTEAAEAQQVRAIQAYHLSKGYVDIAYEALVGATGNIYVGRANNIWDASTCNNNRNGYGICALTDGFITKAQANSIQFAMVLGHLKFPNLARTPKPHSAACATSCPGDTIRAWIGTVHW
jgi:hypothetical protein